MKKEDDGRKKENERARERIDTCLSGAKRKARIELETKPEKRPVLVHSRKKRGTPRERIAGRRVIGR